MKKCGTLFLILFSLSVVGRTQTLFPPDLNCVTIGNNNDITLSWTLPNNPCGFFTAYEIYGSYNGGAYSLIATILDSLQTDTLLAGIDTGAWNFYMLSVSACAGYTQQSSDTLDDQPPVTPVIDFITCNQPMGITLQWQPSPSPETYGYICYQYIGGQYFPVDTVYGINNTTWVKPGIVNNQLPLSFTIAAIDSCGNTGLINTAPHQTIYAFTISANCSSNANLYWTRYINWQSGVHHYEVFESMNNGLFVRIDSTHDSTASFFYGTDSLCFVILAYSDTGAGAFVSASNFVCIPPNPDAPVTDLYVRNVTVPSGGVVDVYYSMNPRSDVRSLKIARGTDGLNFSDIDVVTVPSNLNLVNFYSDNTALTSQTSYYYRFTAIDSCGADTFSSVGKSILLIGNAYSNLKNHLEWDQSYLQYGGVIRYAIYRKNSLGVFDSINSVNASTLMYDEDATALVDELNGTLCYKIIATDTIHFPNGLIDTVRSQSNEVCIDQLVKILVPNAFAPNGKNNIFKPVLRFADNKSYLFQVYNRWGGIIFSTSDAAEGWDGEYKGRLVEQGVYAYLVQVVDGEGHNTERKGTVMLLR